MILVAIHTSLPVAAEEAALLQVVGVLDPSAMIIMGAATSIPGGPGTSTGGITPQGSRAIGALAPPPHQITPDFLHPLALPDDCIKASDWTSTSKTETEGWLLQWHWEGAQQSLPPAIGLSGHETEPFIKASIQGPGPNDQVVHYSTPYY